MENISAFASEAANNLDLSHAVMLAGGTALSVFTAYINTVKKLKDQVTGLIAQAESEYSQWQNSGTLKHSWVVKKLGELLPAPLKPFFPEKKLEEIVVKAFGSIQEYVGQQNIISTPPEQEYDSPYTEVVTPETYFDGFASNGADGAEGRPPAVRVEYRRPNEFTIIVTPE